MYILYYTDNLFNAIERHTKTNNEHFCCWRIKCRLISFYLQLFFLSILCERLSIAFSLHFQPGTHKVCAHTITIISTITITKTLQKMPKTLSLSGWIDGLIYAIHIYAYTSCTLLSYAFLNFTGYFIYLIFEMIVFWRFSAIVTMRTGVVSSAGAATEPSVHLLVCTIKIQPLSIFLEFPRKP